MTLWIKRTALTVVAAAAMVVAAATVSPERYFIPPPWWFDLVNWIWPQDWVYVIVGCEM